MEIICILLDRGYLNIQDRLIFSWIMQHNNYLSKVYQKNYISNTAKIK